jgi:hypothetical protein
VGSQGIFLSRWDIEMHFDPSEPIFGPDVPDEIRDQITARHEYGKLTVQDNQHAVRSLMDSLNADQLKALDILIHNVQMNDHNGSFLRGEITMRLWQDYQVCPCGEDHDPDQEFSNPKYGEEGNPKIPNSENHLKGKPIKDTDLE